MTPFQPEELLACLERRGVRYVLIGGLAAVLHGLPQPTRDVDICPSRDRENLQRLAEALEDLGARIRAPGADEGLAFPRDATFLGNVQVLNLVTNFGDLDVSFTPSGTTGYADLASHAVTITMRTLNLPVASIEDVIRSKEAANRPKDQRTLPLLRMLQDEIRKRRGGCSS